MSRNVRKSMLAALAIRILGGSPTRVAAPPMLDAITLVMRKGTGLTDSREATKSVTGAMRTTTVTLSSMAELNAVNMAIMIMIFKGLPRPRRTA